MKKILREVFDWVKTFVIIFIIVTLVHKYVFTPVKVDGPSMYPTLHDEDSVILWKLGYQPKPFDVVVFEYSPNVYYVKRVIGIPGQTVSYYDDQLYVDNQPVMENYLQRGKSVVAYSGSLTEDFTLEDICQFDECSVIPEDD